MDILLLYLSGCCFALYFAMNLVDKYLATEPKLQENIILDSLKFKIIFYATVFSWILVATALFIRMLNEFVPNINKRKPLLYSDIYMGLTVCDQDGCKGIVSKFGSIHNVAVEFESEGYGFHCLHPDCPDYDPLFIQQ